MKLIPLTKGYSAKVDDEDYDYLMRWKWFASRQGQNGEYFYAVSCSHGKRILMHRLLISPPPNLFIDHVDGDGLNNQRSNLRLANRKQNSANRKPTSGSTSKFLGVHFKKLPQKWAAQIQNDGNVIWLGYYDNENEAAEAYNQAAIKYFGEFARINVMS